MRDIVGTFHDCCCCFWVAGSLITRLAKGDRIPLTLQLKPLVEPSTDVWNQHSGQDLEDKQVIVNLVCSCPQCSAIWCICSRTGKLVKADTPIDRREVPAFIETGFHRLHLYVTCHQIG